MMKTIRSEVIRWLVILSVTACILPPSHFAIANPITVTREYTYRASEADSKLTSRTIALEQVKRLLLEELGTYLVSNTEVKDSALTKDEIVTYTSGWVLTVIVKESWNGEEYYLKANITADADEVAKAIAIMREDRDRFAELKRLREQAGDSLKEITRLRQELANARSSSKGGGSAEATVAQKDYDLAVARLAANETAESEFDGRWAVSLICEDTQFRGSPVKGYTYNFFVDVKDGNLIGRYGQSGQPASLTMVGVIRKDGGIKINASGWSGKNPKYVIGQPNKQYSYRMDGKFNKESGKAYRTEARPCEATFFKQ